MRALALLLLVAPALAETRVIETEHYSLHAEAPQAVAEEYGRVLEAAYGQWEKFFKAKPKLKKGQKLVVRFYDTREAWEKGILAEHGKPPAAPDAGLYWPPTRTAYLYKQTVRYYTRVLLLHETGHQFHFLARTKNNEPGSKWYTEGVVEFLASHSWDGKSLALGVLPICSLEDYAGHALELARKEGFGLQKFVETADQGYDKQTRPMGWAVYRFAATGEGGKPLKGYFKWTKKMDGGNAPGPLFKRTFGRGKDLQERFLRWLESEQEPWKSVWPEWYAAGPNALRGYGPRIAACHPKQKTSVLNATLEAPRTGKWKAGILLHYTSATDYSVCLLDWGGFIRIARKVGSGWRTLEQGQGPPRDKDGNYVFQVFRRGDSVSMLIGMDGYGPWELPGDVLGLVLERCEVTFSNIGWR